ncbi:hypothetical protein VUR80DRAFT_1001 [Thermomyces stellatus]
MYCSSPAASGPGTADQILCALVANWLDACILMKLFRARLQLVPVDRRQGRFPTTTACLAAKRCTCVPGCSLVQARQTDGRTPTCDYMPDWQNLTPIMCPPRWDGVGAGALAIFRPTTWVGSEPTMRHRMQPLFSGMVVKSEDKRRILSERK